MKIKERLITVADFVMVLRRFFLLILACALVFGAAGYLYARKTATVTYTATSGVYVQTADMDMNAGSTANQISLARALALSCKNAVKSESVYENVKDYFAEQRKTDSSWEDLSSVSNNTLRAMVACEVESNSQYVDIVVTAPTASLAVHLANAVAAVMEDSVVSVIGNCRIDPTTVARNATGNSDFSYAPAITAAVVGAFLAFCLFFALHFFDTRVRLEDMHTCYEGVSVLGSLYLPHAHEDTAVPTLRANLLSRLPSEGTSLVLLTAVSQKTAATMLPVDLATSLSDTGRRVLLINGMNGENATASVADAMAGKAEVAQAVKANLDCLSLGKGKESEADLLGNREFIAFLESMREKYDIILLCVKPVAEWADAVTAAAYADGVLLAATPGKDKRAALNRALLSLSLVEAKILGTVASGI